MGSVGVIQEEHAYMNINPITVNTTTAAKLLNISRSQLYSWIKRGILKTLSASKRNKLLSYQALLDFAQQKNLDPKTKKDQT